MKTTKYRKHRDGLKHPETTIDIIDGAIFEEQYTSIYVQHTYCTYHTFNFRSWPWYAVVNLVPGGFCSLTCPYKGVIVNNTHGYKNEAAKAHAQNTSIVKQCQTYSGSQKVEEQQQ